MTRARARNAPHQRNQLAIICQLDDEMPFGNREKKYRSRYAHVGLFTDADKTLIAVNERAFNYLTRCARTNVVSFLRAPFKGIYRLEISGY